MYLRFWPTPLGVDAVFLAGKSHRIYDHMRYVVYIIYKPNVRSYAVRGIYNIQIRMTLISAQVTSMDICIFSQTEEICRAEQRWARTHCISP
jgi:hypothetical protein